MGDSRYKSSFETTDWPQFDIADTLDAASSRRSQPHHGSGTLPLLQLADWNEDNAYDERPPTCIHYSIE
jgi:hypothetical protein